MQHNQVFVIQVSSGAKPPLALPAPPVSLLPSEVKYSASLVCGLGYTHLVLGAVLFLLGVLGSWVEPETCWSGAGVWTGLSTICCGVSGLLAHRLWYKNFTIKTFLVTSVVSVVINVLAIILTVYAIINRHQHYFHLLDEAENNPWFQPYDLDKQHRLTVSVSANQLVGFILELLLALWSTKVGWRGVHAPEFSAASRDSNTVNQHTVASLPRHSQQVPLAALYQLLQAHPELLGNKSLGGSLGAPWSTGLDERPSHLSMDYQERVNRFLSHAIEDQNVSFSRSPSTLRRETRDVPSPTASSSITGSGGRGSPAETVVMLSEPPSASPEQKKDIICIKENPETEKKPKSNKVYRNNGEHKVKAPAPKVNSKMKEKEHLIALKKHQQTEVSNVITTNDEDIKANEENCRKSERNSKKENADQEKLTDIKNEEVTSDSKQSCDPDHAKNRAIELCKKSKKTENHKEGEGERVQKTSELLEDKNVNLQCKPLEQENEIKSTKVVDMTKENCMNTEKTLKSNHDQSSNNTLTETKCESENTIGQGHLGLVACIQPPSEFQDESVAKA